MSGLTAGPSAPRLARYCAGLKQNGQRPVPLHSANSHCAALTYGKRTRVGRPPEDHGDGLERDHDKALGLACQRADCSRTRQHERLLRRGVQAAHICLYEQRGHGEPRMYKRSVAFSWLLFVGRCPMDRVMRFGPTLLLVLSVFAVRNYEYCRVLSQITNNLIGVSGAARAIFPKTENKIDFVQNMAKFAYFMSIGHFHMATWRVSSDSHLHR